MSFCILCVKFSNVKNLFHIVLLVTSKFVFQNTWFVLHYFQILFFFIVLRSLSQVNCVLCLCVLFLHIHLENWLLCVISLHKFMHLFGNRNRLCVCVHFTTVKCNMTESCFIVCNYFLMHRSYSGFSYVEKTISCGMMFQNYLTYSIWLHLKVCFLAVCDSSMD